MSNIIVAIYNFLWGDLITLNFKGTSIGIPLLVILLIPTGIYFTVRTRFMPIRKLPQMVRALGEKKDDKSNLSTFQTLIVSTATRVGMGNLVGVVAAVSIGGAGAVFWMWVSAFLGASTAYVEARLPNSTRKKTRFTAAITAVPLTTFTTLWSKRERKNQKIFYCNFICDFRFNMLVRNKSGCQQFRHLGF